MIIFIIGQSMSCLFHKMMKNVVKVTPSDVHNLKMFSLLSQTEESRKYSHSQLKPENSFINNYSELSLIKTFAIIVCSPTLDSEVLLHFLFFVFFLVHGCSIFHVRFSIRQWPDLQAAWAPLNHLFTPVLLDYSLAHLLLSLSKTMKVFGRMS